MAYPFEALDANPYDFSGNKSPSCPHCGEAFDITENDAWFLYDENSDHDVDCSSCAGAFLVRSSAEWRFSTDEQERDDEPAETEHIGSVAVGEGE